MGPLTPGATPSPVTRPSTSEGVTQVLPDIPTPARNTITGSVRINIRVRVDNAGNVTEATPESPMGSKYFTDRALAASRSWKFPPGSGPQDWILRFELTRDQIRASSTKLN
jgi:TonB family protein